jgi:hypothetical protein
LRWPSKPAATASGWRAGLEARGVEAHVIHASSLLIEGTEPFATAKPDARLVKLLIRARQFNATLLDSDGVPFAALAKREGVSPSYFTRLVL